MSRLADWRQDAGIADADDAFLNSTTAVCVPKGRPLALGLRGEFIEEAKASGLVRKSVDEMGLTSSIVAPSGMRGMIRKACPRLDRGSETVRGSSPIKAIGFPKWNCRGSGYFFALAALSMAFVGFSAIVVVLRQGTGKTLSKLHVLFTKLFVELGLMATAFAMLSPTLAICGIAEPLVWQLSSAIVLMTLVPWLIAYPSVA